MDRRIKKTIGLIIPIILILMGLFIILRIYTLITDFKRSDNLVQIRNKLPISFPISYVNQQKKIIMDSWLIIPAINVDLKIGTQQRFLDFGGWIVKTDGKNMPVAIGIHRFGLNNLTNEQRIHQTLLHADQLKIEDVINLDWNGNEYSYRVENITVDTNNPAIGNNQLLLYTCEYWSSPERVFILADKII